jgi:hypothetical protein
LKLSKKKPRLSLKTRGSSNTTSGIASGMAFMFLPEETDTNIAL